MPSRILTGVRHDYGTEKNSVLTADPGKEAAASQGEEEGSCCLVKRSLIRILYSTAEFCSAHTEEHGIGHLLAVICYELDSCRILICSSFIPKLGGIFTLSKCILAFLFHPHTGAQGLSLLKHS